MGLPLSPSQQQARHLELSALRPMSEGGHQKAIFIWAAWNSGRYPELKWLHSNQTGAKMTPATAGKMKAEGMRAGVPDIYLDVPLGGYHGLRIELKVPEQRNAKGTIIKRKGVCSPEQLEWLAHYAESGFCAHVCYGWEHSIQVIEHYLLGRLHA